MFQTCFPQGLIFSRKNNKNPKIWGLLLKQNPMMYLLPDLRVGPTGGFVTSLSVCLLLSVECNQPFKELGLSRKGFKVPMVLWLYGNELRRLYGYGTLALWLGMVEMVSEGWKWSREGGKGLGRGEKDRGGGCLPRLRTLSYSLEPALRPRPGW
jgi:hypothetical protein